MMPDPAETELARPAPEPAPPPLRIPPVDTQLNWLARYLPYRHLLEGPAQRSLLEVGAGPYGVSSVFPGAFVGVDVAFSHRPVPSMVPYQYGGSILPFQPASFHTVISMDTVEHVPPPQRADFLKDLGRVAAARVIVGFPVNAGGPSADQMLQALHHKMHLREPVWLREHEEHGLPLPADIERALDGLPGWTWRRLPAVGALVNLLVVLGDLLVDARSWITPLLANHGPELEAWMKAGCFGPADRHVYLLERLQPATATVDIDDGASLLRALACPDCGGPVSGASALSFACARCARAFTLGPIGVVPLAPRTVTFCLRPGADDSGEHWTRAVLAYTQAFQPEQRRLLFVDVDPRDGHSEAALARLQAVLAPLGERPFPEVVFNDDPSMPPGPGQVVYLPADSAGLDACTPAWFAGRAAQATSR